MLDEFSWSGRLDDGAGQAALEADPLALHVGPGGAQQIKRLRISAKVHPNFLKYGVSVALYELQAFLVEQPEDGEMAVYIGCVQRRATLACNASEVSASRPLARPFGWPRWIPCCPAHPSRAPRFGPHLTDICWMTGFSGLILPPGVSASKLEPSSLGLPGSQVSDGRTSRARYVDSASIG